MISLFELIFVPEVEGANEKLTRFAPDEPGRVAAFIRGDRDAFNWVFSEYSDALYRFVFRYLKDEESSREMVQESFLKLFSNRKALTVKKGLGVSVPETGSAILLYTRRIGNKLQGISAFKESSGGLSSPTSPAVTRPDSGPPGHWADG